MYIRIVDSEYMHTICDPHIIQGVNPSGTYTVAGGLALFYVKMVYIVL